MDSRILPSTDCRSTTHHLTRSARRTYPPSLLGILFLVPTLVSGLPTEKAKLTANDGAEDDFFGHAVAVDGDILVVGAHGDDNQGSLSGNAYVFERIDGLWTPITPLLPTAVGTFDYFGWSLALDGDTLAVGTIGDSAFAGCVYIFQRSPTTWLQTAKLSPDDLAQNDSFGTSVALDGDTLVVGNPGDDDNGSLSGSAYVFQRDGVSWVQTAKLTPDDGATLDAFGISVAVDGDTLAVGARWDDDKGDDAGSAYVFQHDGLAWQQSAKLTADDGVAEAEFGYAMALAGDTLVVGALNDDDNGPASGGAYVFQRSAGIWTQAMKLLPSDGAAGDEFGGSVALSRDASTIVVGAEKDNDFGSNSGSAYVFQRSANTWMESIKLTPEAPGSGDRFGVSVSISGNRIAIGANYHEDNGGAYLFESPAIVFRNGLETP